MHMYHYRSTIVTSILDIFKKFSLYLLPISTKNKKTKTKTTKISLGHGSAMSFFFDKRCLLLLKCDMS